ncbi:MAG: class I SAM-dependent methyltransferase [Deltaproteobacteria bacterium]|nr:class I SAM-dependent methyltransferase [Deltaproteobacteria bacterium]
MTDENHRLRSKYQITSWFYDILDYPWERQYRKWRPEILKDVDGRVLEAGVGTGHNLRHYSPSVNLTAIDLSSGMLRQARKRRGVAQCKVDLQEADATSLKRFADGTFDWYISTFMYCVMPDSLQPLALREMARILKSGGRFRLIEILYSKDRSLQLRQKLLAPFVELVYGARFDRKTLDHIRSTKSLKVTRTTYLKADTYLLIEGEKI